MHQTRQSASTKLPIPRKGTKYVARASSHLNESVPVLIAVRNMLHLAHTAREVRQMVKEGLLKVNGEVARDYHRSICLFNILQAGKKHYQLTLLPTGKFSLEETTFKNGRVCKVVGKRLVRGEGVQLNLHDGTNILTKEKVTTGDSIYLDETNKLKKHVALEKGKEVYIIRGRWRGQKGKIASIVDNKLTVAHNGSDVQLSKEAVVVV